MKAIKTAFCIALCITLFLTQPNPVCASEIPQPNQGKWVRLSQTEYEALKMQRKVGRQAYKVQQFFQEQIAEIADGSSSKGKVARVIGSATAGGLSGDIAGQLIGGGIGVVGSALGAFGAPIAVPLTAIGAVTGVAIYGIHRMTHEPSREEPEDQNH